MASKQKTVKATSKKVTTAAFIKEAIRAKKLSDAAILAAARKRAPKQKIADHYVSWYRWQMKNARAHA